MAEHFFLIWADNRRAPLCVCSGPARGAPQPSGGRHSAHFHLGPAGSFADRSSMQVLGAMVDSSGTMVRHRLSLAAALLAPMRPLLRAAGVPEAERIQRLYPVVGATAL